MQGGTHHALVFKIKLATDDLNCCCKKFQMNKKQRIKFIVHETQIFDIIQDKKIFGLRIWKDIAVVQMDLFKIF